MSTTGANPKKIFLFSGKRKCGKDFVTENLLKLLDPSRAVIIRISGPIKTRWSKENNLDLDLLLSDSNYKEQYRRQMVEWSENVRREDYGYFCRAALDMYGAYDKPFWVVSDIRRKTDVKWFYEHFGDKVKNIRIICDVDTRRERGWEYVEGIDNLETECDLDDFTSWDQILSNDGRDLSEILAQLASELTQSEENL